MCNISRLVPSIVKVYVRRCLVGMVVGSKLLGREPVHVHAEFRDVLDAGVPGSSEVGWSVAIVADPRLSMHGKCRRCWCNSAQSRLIVGAHTARRLSLQV
jgi:hypothetical protein